MLSRIKFISFVCPFLCLCPLGTAQNGSQGVDSFAARAVLRYRNGVELQNRDLQFSFSVVETLESFTGAPPDMAQIEEHGIELRKNFNWRIESEENRYGFTATGEMETEPTRTTKARLIDGNKYLYYRLREGETSPKHVSFDDNLTKSRQRATNSSRAVLAIDGWVQGNDGLSIADVLERSDTTIEVLPGEGALGYKLKADSKYGEYVLWFNSELESSPVRIQVSKSQGDLHNGSFLGGDKKSDTNKNPMSSYSLDLQVLETQSLDELKVPVAIAYEKNIEYIDGRSRLVKGMYQRSNVKLGVSEGDLEMDIEVGTPVAWAGPRSKTGLRYIWNGDSPILSYDKDVVAQLESEIEQIVGVKEEKTQVGDATLSHGAGDLKDSQAMAKPEQSARGTMLLYVTGVAFLVIVFAGTARNVFSRGRVCEPQDKG